MNSGAFHRSSSCPGSSSSSRSRREAGEHSALYGAEGLAEAVGELGLREAAVVGELDRLALLVGQPLERLLHACALEAEPGLLVRRASRRLGLLLQRLRPARLLAADEIDGAAVHQRQDPRARLRALGDEARGRPPDGEEGLLHRVLCERRVPDNADRQTVCDAPKRS